MPKIIPQVRESLIEAAKPILRGDGFGSLSVRDISAACGIAVGTFYHYFKSKNELAAAVMLEDWIRVLSEIDGYAASSAEFTDGMRGFYDAVSHFSERYREVWAQFSASGGTADVIYSHHRQLRGQISSRIVRLAEASGAGVCIPYAELLGEMLLSAVLQPDISKEQLISLLSLIMK